jgi:hypothetical protein
MNINVYSWTLYCMHPETFKMIKAGKLRWMGHLSTVQSKSKTLAGSERSINQAPPDELVDLLLGQWIQWQ